MFSYALLGQQSGDPRTLTRGVVRKVCALGRRQQQPSRPGLREATHAATAPAAASLR